MRVSLLKAPTGGIIGLEMITFVEPLGLECIAGGLEPEGHACQIVDLRLDGLDAGLDKVGSFGPDVIGLQCNFTTERYRMLRVARTVKERFPDALILLGGHDASRDPEWFDQPWIDIVAIGDGEDIVPLLVDALERGADLSEVPGLKLNHRGTDGEAVYTGHAPARGDVDDLPLPARHLIRDYAGEYYINFRRPLALMESARGCPFKCNFCSVWKFHESDVSREIAGDAWSSRSSSGDRGSQRLYHRRHLLDERQAAGAPWPTRSRPRAFASTSRSRHGATSSASSPS